MKNYMTLALALFLMLAACNHKVISEFEIVNDTTLRIDSLSIEPNADVENKYISLAPKETHTYRANMAGKNADGSYILSYKLNNMINRRSFGYYSNGTPLEYLTNINIALDSVVIVKEY